MTALYPIVLFSFIISLSTFIKKDILKVCSFKEFIYLEYILLLLPIFLYIMFINVYNKPSHLIKKLSVKLWMYLLLATFLTIISPFIYYYLISNYSINKISPIINPLIIIFTILLGFFIFNETITKQEIIGIIIIIVGIIISLYKNNI